MAQNYAFLAYGATTQCTVTGNGGVNTVTVLGNSTTGLPASAWRIYNAGTAICFIQPGSNVSLTVTGAAANGMPAPQSVAPWVMRSGGNAVIQFGSTSTFTTTLMVTAGEGID